MLAVTAGDELFSTKKEHNHDVRPGKIEANQIMHQMKKEARQQVVPVNSSIIATCHQEVTDEKAVQLSLPSRAAINRTLNCQKQNLVPSLPIIKDRHFIIPTEYSDFCLVDIGVMDPERILIYKCVSRVFNQRLLLSPLPGFFFKINELGFKKPYENNCELSLALRLIPALSFVPTDLVEQSFESVI